MRTPSGILHVVDFKTSQIVSNIQPKDYWDDKRHWEIKNNIDTLEFKVFDNTDHAVTLMQQNLVLKEVRDGRIVPYVITEAEKDSDDRSVIAYASGEWIQLAKAGIINPQKIVGKTVNEFIDIALVGTKWKRGKTEYAGFHTMTIDEFIDPLKFLKDIASLFDLEIQYRAEVVGSQIVGRYVDMVKKRGRDTGKEVTLGKDLMGIKRIENSQNICTALLGFVKKENGDFITISSINNGVPYLVDNDAFQRWNERGQHKFGFYTPETEQDITPQRLMTLMKTEIKKRVNTSVSYEVNAQSIGRVFGLAHELINEGDTIRIKDTGFTPKLYLEARAIAGDESFTAPSQDKYVFGDYRELVDQSEEWRRYYKQLVSQLGGKATQDYVDQLKLIAEKAEAEAAQAIIDANLADRAAQKAKEDAEYAKALADQINKDSANWQTVIKESTNAPTTGLVAGKSLWLDISKGKPGILKKWNGTTWEAIVPDTKQLEQDVQTWVNNELDKIKGDMEDLVDINWLNEQMKGKADKADTYTKTDVDTALNGKVSNSKYTTDQQGVLQKFENQQTQINQNAKDITLSATKTELSTVDGKLDTTNGKVAGLEGDMVNVKKEASELKVEVGKISTSVSEVTGKVNGMKFGVENLLIRSKDNETPFWAITGNTKTAEKYLDTSVWSSTEAWSGLEYLTAYLRDQGVQKLQTDYTFSMYMRVVSPNSDKKVDVKFYCGSATDNGKTVANVGVAWQRVTHTFKWISTSDDRLRFEPINTATEIGATRFEYAAYQLEEGNIVSSYKPSSKDAFTSGGGNVIRNSSFDRGLMDWDYNNSTAKAKITVPQNPDLGSVLKIANAGAATDQYIGVKQQLIDLIPKSGQVGEQISISFFIKWNSAAANLNEDQFAVELQDTTDSNKPFVSNLYVTRTAVQQWRKVTHTFTVTKSFKNPQIVIWLRRNGDIEVSNFMLNRGNLPLEWSPSPMDRQLSGGTNLLLNSSGNNEFVKHKGAAKHFTNKATVTNVGDYIHMVCNDYTDSFYQFTDITSAKTEMYGFKADTNYVLSFEADTDSTDMNFVLFEYLSNGTLTEVNTKTFACVSNWRRYEVRFRTTAGITGLFFRLRFPKNAASNGKIFRFKKVQIEEGEIASDWNRNADDLTLNTEFVKKTSEIIQTVDGITQRVENTESGLTGVKSRVGMLETTSTGITGRVTEVEKVNTAQGNILTSQGQTITTHTSEINVLKNQITLTVSKDEAQGYVSAAGRENIIKNAVLSSGKYWGFHAGVSHDPSLNYKGYGVLKTIQSGLTADSWRGAYTDRYPCVGGNYYVASAWAYRTTAMDRGASYEIQFFDKAGTRIGTAYSSITDANLPINTWKKFQTDEYKAPDNAVSMFFRFHVVRNGTLMISQPTLQAGKIASTDFYPSPFDYTNQEQLISDVSNKVNTSDYNQKVTQIDNRLTINEKGLDLKASKSEVYTQTQSDGRYAKDAYVKELEGRVQVTEKNILSTVKKGDIISSINQTAEKITIDVSKLAINADTMVQWLTAKGIDTNIIKINGDKITIDKNGVTIKMLDFLFEDEWGTKTTVMPKRNLIADHDFSSVPKSNIGNPNYQGFGAGYGLPWKVQGNGVVIENNTFIFNYEQMVNAVRVDTYNYPETKVQNGIHPGNTYTLSAHYRTAQINGVRVTAKPRLQVCFVTPLDEVSYKIWHEIYKDFPEPSTFYGEIRRYNFTFTVPNNYNPQEHMIVVKITAANAQISAGKAVCVSGITLVSGNYACMYNWDRAASERADGLQPFNRIAIGGVNNNIGPAAHGQTFDISTEKDVFINQPILTQGINLGRNRMGQAGSIRFFDGGQGYGFYFMGMGGQWYKLPNV
ncbi:phage tail spike protein [Bacillus thuringiensis]|uniref:Phage tail spike protein n=1 Tax=Bacillus thuringiensis TaxID=1428 RepID=A0AAW9G8B9_BACTU|nr:phage tail spike protein [Bacillus thuringiensis]MDY0850408.1 phage tail spike protein [Bacillus thuringiensis]MDY4389234.1 phage tail spike protein [Bacillus thuringiensis]